MSEMPTPADDLVVIGKIVSVYGIRGEVKVYSFTDPLDNLLDYRRWTLRRDGEIRQAELVRGACMAGPGRQAQGARRSRRGPHLHRLRDLHPA